MEDIQWSGGSLYGSITNNGISFGSSDFLMLTPLQPTAVQKLAWLGNIWPTAQMSQFFLRIRCGRIALIFC
jgi:hypothetical protein